MKVELIIYYRIIYFYFYFLATIVDSDKDGTKQTFLSLDKSGGHKQTGHDSEKAFIGDDQLKDVKIFQRIYSVKIFFIFFLRMKVKRHPKSTKDTQARI
jgi:hypothetical protein